MDMINASLLWTCFSSFTSKSNSNSPSQLMKGAALSYRYVLLEWQAKSWIWISVILDQKQKPWNAPCSFSFKAYAFSLRWGHILQPVLYFAGQKFQFSYFGRDTLTDLRFYPAYRTNTVIWCRAISWFQKKEIEG